MKEELIKQLSVKTYSSVNGVDVDKLHAEVIAFMNDDQALPSTLSEALRNHDMFNAFVTTTKWVPAQLRRFVDNWLYRDYWPEYIEFVEKELSK